MNRWPSLPKRCIFHSRARARASDVVDILVAVKAALAVEMEMAANYHQASGSRYRRLYAVANNSASGTICRISPPAHGTTKYCEAESSIPFKAAPAETSHARAVACWQLGLFRVDNAYPRRGTIVFLDGSLSPGCRNRASLSTARLVGSITIQTEWKCWDSNGSAGWGLACVRQKKEARARRSCWCAETTLKSIQKSDE
jgi:hypothetical protein